MKVRAYVITTDAGSAPNHDPACTTLAVCKPRIHQAAALGDLVLAYAGSDVHPHEPPTVSHPHSQSRFIDPATAAWSIRSSNPRTAKCISRCDPR